MPNKKKLSLEERGVKGLQIQIPEKAHEALLNYSRVSGISLSDVITNFLDYKLLHNETKRLLQETLKNME